MKSLSEGARRTKGDPDMIPASPAKPSYGQLVDPAGPGTVKPEREKTKDSIPLDPDANQQRKERIR